MNITSIGLDIAKNVFHAVGFDARGKEVMKKILRRPEVLPYFANLPVCTVTLETCCGAHYWHRQLSASGHRVQLIAAQHVRPYVMGNKNDYNDARAIAEAASRPAMRFVKAKTELQQTLQSVLRLRRLQVEQRTALSNQLRGLLAEQGMVLPQGLAALRTKLGVLTEAANTQLPPRLQALFACAYAQLLVIDQYLVTYDKQLQALAREEEDVKRLFSIPGFGPVLSCAFVGAIGDGQSFRKGRDVAACVGLVPKQHSSGGKEVLLGISKRGDGYLRSLLIHGARSVMIQAARRDDRLSRWVMRLSERRGKNRATVALANKLARIGWAVLRHRTAYEAVSVEA